jgi:hypothetical protein
VPTGIDTDVADPLTPDVLTPAAALVVAGELVDTVDPVTPSDGGEPENAADVAVEELSDPVDDGLLLGVAIAELIDEESDDVGAVWVNSSAMPLLPSTDPV